MNYIGLDVHRKAISYCVKEAAGCVHQEGQGGLMMRHAAQMKNRISRLQKARDECLALF